MADNKYCIEYASNGRAKCKDKDCTEKFSKGELRIGKVTKNPFSEDEDAEMTVWYHPECIFRTLSRARASTKKIEETDDLEGWDEIEESDQEEVLAFMSMDFKKAAKKGGSKKKVESEDEDDEDDGAVVLTGQVTQTISVSGTSMVVITEVNGKSTKETTKARSAAMAKKLVAAAVKNAVKQGYEKSEADAEEEEEEEEEKPKKKLTGTKRKAPPAKKAAPAAKKTKASGGGGKVLSGVTIAISGTLSMKRNDFKKLVADNGGTVASSLTKAVQYLVTTEAEVASRTSKVDKAEASGVPLVAEDFIVDSVENGELADPDDYLVE